MSAIVTISSISVKPALRAHTAGRQEQAYATLQAIEHATIIGRSHVLLSMP